MNIKEEYSTVRGYQLQKKGTRLLTDSMEDYMEMIYRQCLKEDYTRINIIAQQLNIQPPSVSKMVQKLACLGLLNYEKYGIIRLTEKGRAIGGFLLYRHNTIKTFLKLLSVDTNLLSQTEALEHNVDVVTLKKIDILIKFFQEEPMLQEKYNNYVKNKV